MSDKSIEALLAELERTNEQLQREIAARRKAERELQTSERRLAEAQRMAKLGSWELDLEKNELYWSDEIYRIFGIDPGQFQATYEAFLSAVHPDDVELVNQAYTTAIETGTPYEIDHRIITPAGEVKYVHESSVEMKDEIGQVVRSVGTVQDITEQKLAEIELDQYRQRLEEMVAERTKELNALNEQLQEEVAERKQMEMTLWERTHELGERVKELNCLYGISDLVEERDSLEEILQGTVDLIRHAWRYPESTCVHIILGDQEYRTENFATVVAQQPTWMCTSSILVHGQQVGAVGVYYLEEVPKDDERPLLKEDHNLINAIAKRLGRVIERVRGGRMLRESEGLLRAIAANYPAYLSIIRKDLTVGFTSGREFTQRGLDPTDFIGLTLEEAFGEQGPIVKEHYLRAFAGEVVSFELSINNQDQLHHVVPLPDGNGETQRVLAVVEDITERKRMEGEVKNALKEKELLLREIHHRVKNNLQIVASLLFLQADVAHDGHLAGMLQESQDRIRSMALIHELLYGSKDLSSVDFGQYIPALTAHLLRAYHARTISLETEANAVLPIDIATPCALIINELVSNAIRHAFPDGRDGHIRVSLTPDQDQFILVVQDDGVGAPPGLASQTAETLGLQLVGMLVEQLNGTIEWDRTRGTTATIRFGGLEYKKRL